MAEHEIEFTVPFPEWHCAGRMLWQAGFTDRGLRWLRVSTARSARKDSTPANARERVLIDSVKARMHGENAELGWDAFDLEGRPDFHVRVWKAMRQIPFGRVKTYGEVAEAAGSPMAFRACGQACGNNPILLFIPCHRVVASSGIGGFGCGLEWKRLLLGTEGNSMGTPLFRNT